MRIAPLLALALISTAGWVRAQGPAPKPTPAEVADEKALWAAEYAVDQASLKGDADARARIQLPSYISTAPDGTVIPRSMALEALRAGTLRFQTLALHEGAAKIEGDTAIVSGRLAAEFTTGGTSVQGIFAVTDTWVKKQGEWRELATQTTLVAPTIHYGLEPLPRDLNWVARHEKMVRRAKQGGVDLLFLGDSITDFWQSRGAAVFKKYWGNVKTANFGISGDRTEHVLWRMQHGELDGIHPKAIMLMIGTNNIGPERDGSTLRGTPHEAAEGVREIVRELREKLPDAKILLLAVFPRGRTPDDPNRTAAGQINPEIAGLDDGVHVHYLDIGPKFLTASGELTPAIMPDALHPSPAGYEIWARAVKAPLAELMR